MALNIAAALGSYSMQPLGASGGRRISAYRVAATEGSYIILPLRGHTMDYITRGDLEHWTHDSVDRILNDPESLVKVVSSSGYYSAIRILAGSSSEIVIVATDSDEEGENIGLEVMEILWDYSKPVKRLWLTTTIPSDIRRAFSCLREFNWNLALSVEASRKIDAVVGFAGTKEVTLTLKSVAGGTGVLSFGRVQTSTLWIAL